MTREEIKGRVIEFIHENGYVTYVELQELFYALGYNYHGDLRMVHPKYDHVLFWRGWNQDAIDVMNELLKEHKVYKKPTQYLTYWLDGKVLHLPIVTECKDYKKDHWLPVVFYTGAETENRRNSYGRSKMD